MVFVCDLIEYRESQFYSWGHYILQVLTYLQHFTAFAENFLFWEHQPSIFEK